MDHNLRKRTGLIDFDRYSDTTRQYMQNGYWDMFGLYSPELATCIRILRPSNSELVVQRGVVGAVVLVRPDIR